MLGLHKILGNVCQEKGYRDEEDITHAITREEFRPNDVVALVILNHLNCTHGLLEAAKQQYYDAFCTSPYTKKFFDTLYERSAIVNEVNAIKKSIAEEKGAFDPKAALEAVMPYFKQMTPLEETLQALMYASRFETEPIESYPMELA